MKSPCLDVCRNDAATSRYMCTTCGLYEGEKEEWHRYNESTQREILRRIENNNKAGSVWQKQMFRCSDRRYEKKAERVARNGYDPRFGHKRSR